MTNTTNLNPATWVLAGHTPREMMQPRSWRRTEVGNTHTLTTLSIGVSSAAAVLTLTRSGDDRIAIAHALASLENPFVDPTIVEINDTVRAQIHSHIENRT